MVSVNTIELGQRFGLWTVLEHAGKNANNQSYYLCRCDCGTEKRIRGTSLKLGSRRGGTLSCGCFQRQVCTKHGMTLCGKKVPRIYVIWAGMLDRCRNANSHLWHLYGGRGIKVCERWDKSFTHFLVDMGEPPSPNHSIDRIDCNKGYNKENCRWATAKEQQRNRRNNRLITYQGRTQCLSAWAEEYGIPDGRLDKRLRLGWTLEQALTLPPRPVKWKVA